MEFQAGMLQNEIMIPLLKRLRSLIQHITIGLSTVGMFLLIPMMLMTTGDVMGRALWSYPIPGCVELSSYMLAVFILLGVANTHRVKGMVRVSLLVSRFPQRPKGFIEIMTALFSLFIIAILARQGWSVGIEERTVSDMLRIPQWPFRLLVSLAGFSLCFEILFDLADKIKELMRR
jgi:TRAP-type C4-dicarboxylate transport system permease small subunit